MEKEFRSGSSYEVNGTFLARPQTGADGCIYEYAFVDNEIEQEWKGKDDTGLSWTTESIEDLKDLWKSAKEGVIDLPEEKGLKHLYIRVTRENSSDNHLLFWNTDTDISRFCQSEDVLSV